MKTWTIFAAVAALVGGAGAADAASYTLTFSGTFNGAYGGSGTVAGLGTTFSGSATYNAPVTPYYTYSATGYSFAVYAAIQSISFTSGAVTTTFLPDGVNDDLYLRVDNGQSSGYSDSVEFGANQPGGYNLNLGFSGLPSTMNSLAIPTTIQQYNAYTGRYIFFGDAQNYRSGTVTSFSLAQALPEPASWSMMMLGFGGLGYAMRRRSKVSTRVRFA